MRRTTRYPVSGENSLWNVYKTVSFWKVMKTLLLSKLHVTRHFICEELVVSHFYG